MTWNYRVMNRQGELAIYEVYYAEDGTVKGWSANPTFPAADNITELRVNCDLYFAALEEPVVDYIEDE